jgi:hypothetical protein
MVGRAGARGLLAILGRVQKLGVPSTRVAPDDISVLAGLGGSVGACNSIASSSLCKEVGFMTIVTLYGLRSLVCTSSYLKGDALS